MKNYQTLWIQIQGETGRQTWWETREQRRGWGQSRVPLGGYRDLDGSHEEVETIGTSGSAWNKNETKDQHVLTFIIAKSMLHTYQKQRKIFVNWCLDKIVWKQEILGSHLKDTGWVTCEPTTGSFAGSFEPHLNTIEVFLFMVSVVSPEVFWFENSAYKMMYSFPRLSFPIFENSI